MRAQGPHRYAALAGAKVAEALEALMGLAAGSGKWAEGAHRPARS